MDDLTIYELGFDIDDVEGYKLRVKKHVDAKKGQSMFGKQQLVPWVGAHGSWKGPKYKPHLKTNKKHKIFYKVIIEKLFYNKNITSLQHIIQVELGKIFIIF